MGKNLALIIALVIAAIAISIFMQPDAPDPGSDPAAAAASGAPGRAVRSYALDAARNSWPPIAEGAGAGGGNDPGAVNYYVVLDGSGSMRRTECSGDVTKMEAAISALRTFVGAVPADANLGLAVFDSGGVSERVPLGAHNRDQVREQLAQVQARGGTPLKSSIALGFEKLTEQGRRQLGYGEYHLVVVTDGFPEPSDEDPSEIVRTILDESPVVLHTIGFCIGDDHVLNQKGRVFYVAADNPAQLQQGLSSVLAEAPAFDATKFGQ